jgi:carbon storage regulator
MLVLSRKIGERIHIGDDIVIVISQINGRNVRLGIEAPRSVNVCREELWPGKRQNGNRHDQRFMPEASSGRVGGR